MGKEHVEHEEGVSSSSRYSKAENLRTGSRYANAENQRTGSRYAKSENQRTGSRYAKEESQRTGSRYAKEESQRTGSRYAKEESQRTGSRYAKDEAAGNAKRNRKRSGNKNKTSVTENASVVKNNLPEREEKPTKEKTANNRPEKQVRQETEQRETKRRRTKRRRPGGRDARQYETEQQSSGGRDAKQYEQRGTEQQPGAEQREAEKHGAAQHRSRRRKTAKPQNSPTQTATAVGSTEPEPQSPKRRELPAIVRFFAGNPAAIIAAVFAVVLLSGYIATAVYYSSHFYPGTTIFGINCASETVDVAKAQIEQKIADYKLNVGERDGKMEQITAQQIELVYADEGAIEQCMKAQTSAFWPVMMLVRRGAETQIDTRYDAAALTQTIQSMACFVPENVTAPQDAHVEADAQGYKIVAEKLGNTLNYDNACEAIQTALDAGKDEVSLEMEACYEWPHIYSDDPKLQEEADARNALLGAEITLEMGDQSRAIATEQLMEFMTGDLERGYWIEEAAVRSYVDTLADETDTYGGMRIFHSTIGTEETLYGGDYGWAMNREATAQLILQAIRDKEVTSIEPAYIYTGVCRDKNDIGDTYVEICISLQEMWCYKNGECIVDTPVVTGNPNKNNATPSGGVWAIDGKFKDFTLVGEDYRAPVDYWLPFNGGVGIHDLQSRAYFGSTIYLTNGSHGCVNTPLDQVAIIYENVSEGTPVIVYE